MPAWDSCRHFQEFHHSCRAPFPPSNKQIRRFTPKMHISPAPLGAFLLWIPRLSILGYPGGYPGHPFPKNSNRTMGVHGLSCIGNLRVYVAWVQERALIRNIYRQGFLDRCYLNALVYMLARKFLRMRKEAPKLSASLVFGCISLLIYNNISTLSWSVPYC